MIDKKIFDTLFLAPDTADPSQVEEAAFDFATPDLDRCIGCMAFNLRARMAIDEALTFPDVSFLKISGSCGIIAGACVKPAFFATSDPFLL